MYSQTQLENILFIDIETVSGARTYAEMPIRFQSHWDRKAELIGRRETDSTAAAELYTERAAIFAEFGKVVCISCGYIKFVDERPTFRLKSYCGPDEAVLLTDLAGTLDKFMCTPGRNLCAHNGKEFDFPFLGRRYLIHGLPLPHVLTEIQSAKPWEVRLIDTMHLWKFGDFKSFTSLDLLCAVLDIPSPKSDMDGSDVGRVFWEEQDYGRIARYCQQDVLATAQVLLRFARRPLIQAEDVTAG